MAKAYVRLVDEAVTVYRPVEVEHLHDDVYQINKQDYDPTLEEWEFSPGTTVVCEFRLLSNGDGPARRLVAVRRAN